MKATDDSIRFTVAALNLCRSRWALRTHGSWEAALAFLQAWGKDHDPDIFCLQQAPVEQFEPLALGLSMKSAKCVRSRLEGWEDGCMVLWNPLSFGLMAKQSFWFSASPSLPGSVFHPESEPQAGVTAALHHKGFHVRVASCQWMSEGPIGRLEPRMAAGIASARVLGALFSKGIGQEPALDAFSKTTFGMPSLIAGGFAELKGLRMGRAVLEQEGFAPVFNLSTSMDDLLASPGVKLLDILDTGGLNGQRPMLAEFEISERQDYGVPIKANPLPGDSERSPWPEEESKQREEDEKAGELKPGIK